MRLDRTVRWGISIACAAYLMMSVDAAAAQLSPRDERRLAETVDLSLPEVQRLFDAYAVVQAQEMLNLNDTQYGQFLVRLKDLQQIRRRAQQARRQIVQELQRLSQQRAGGEEAIGERLRALSQHDERANRELAKAYESIDGVLDLRQRARFRVFEEQMERRKFDLLMRARQTSLAEARRQRRTP